MNNFKNKLLSFFLVFISIGSLLCKPVYARGTINTAAAYVPPSKNSSQKYLGQYIDTSRWKRIKHRKKISGGNRKGSGKSRYKTYYTWKLIPGGFYVKEHYIIQMHFDEKFVFTKDNKNSKGENAGLHYIVKVSDLKCKTPNKTFPAKLTSLTIKHKVNRYQNKGLDIYTNSNNSNFIKGKFEYNHAGDDNSFFIVLGKMESDIEYRTADEDHKGKYITRTKTKRFPINASVRIPVNSFNSVNYTGNNERQTDLTFKYCPSGLNPVVIQD